MRPGSIGGIGDLRSVTTLAATARASSAPTWPIDATSGKGMPLTQADWDAVFAAAGVSSKTLSHSWGFQDASGNIAATVGTLLTAAGTLEYQQTVTGWTAKAVRFTDNTTDAAMHAAGVGIDVSTTSILALFYQDIITDVGALRNIIECGGAAAASELSYRRSAGRLNTIKVAGNSTAGTSDPEDGGVRPNVLRHNKTANTSIIANDQEKVTGTHTDSITDGPKGVGAAITVSAGMDVLLGAMFAGADAEWTDAELKAVLQTLGWTIPWS